jgi:HD-like signal output (HDOD) protein
LVLYKHLPLHTGRALNKATQLEMLLYESEHEILGYDHTRIGGLLSKRWKLPERLVNMIRHHHSPQKAADRIEAGIVHLADIITNALEIGSSGEHMVPPLDAAVWESLNIPTTTLAGIIETAEQHIYEMIKILLPASSVKVH